MQHETKHAVTDPGTKTPNPMGEVHVAFQVLGEGPPDIVFCPEWFNNIDIWWEEPRIERFLKRLASFGRLIVFDKRGTGVSDPVPLDGSPVLESWMDDIKAVMHFAHSERAALFGHAGGGQVCMLFAATYPDLVSSLVLSNSWAGLSRPDDDYSRRLEENRLSHPDGLLRTAMNWGLALARGAPEVQTVQMEDNSVRPIPTTYTDLFKRIAPGAVGDKRFCEWFARYMRLSASPGSALPIRELMSELDVDDVLPAIGAPTLVLSRSDHYLGPWYARRLAERIPDARLVDVPGGDHLFFLGDTTAILDEVEMFLTGERKFVESDRVLATVLFTDIVGSTERAAAVGDREWREILEAHDAIVDRELERFAGRRVKHTGDGVLATFEGPGRAVRCAQEVTRAVLRLGIEIRAGLHTGEIEWRGDDVTGMAVNIARRVNELAGRSEVLVSRTVRDIVVGSQLVFNDRGTYDLKGVPDEWRIYAVES